MEILPRQPRIRLVSKEHERKLRSAILNRYRRKQHPIPARRRLVPPNDKQPGLCFDAQRQTQRKTFAAARESPVFENLQRIIVAIADKDFVVE